MPSILTPTTGDERKGATVARIIHAARDERLSASDRIPAIEDDRLPVSELLLLITRSADSAVRHAARETFINRLEESLRNEQRAALDSLFANCERLGMTVSLWDVRMALERASDFEKV